MSNRPNTSRRTTAPKSKAKAPSTGGRVVLSEFKQRKRDEGALVIEVDDGTEFTLDPPALWPDGVTEALSAGDVTQAVQLIMGDDDYTAFCAAGGTATIVASIYEELAGGSLGK